MDITSLTGITSDYIEKVAEQNRLVNTSDDSFQSVLDSAMNVLSETSDLQNDAEAAQIEFALERQIIRMICRLRQRKHLQHFSIQQR